MRWRTAAGGMKLLLFNEVRRRHLMELAMAAGMMECVDARLMEL